MLAPLGRFAHHETTLWNLTAVLNKLAFITTSTFLDPSTPHHSLANVALDYLLAEQGGVCAVINRTWGIYINSTGQVEENIQKLYDQAKWLHQMTKGADITNDI